MAQKPFLQMPQYDKTLVQLSLEFMQMLKCGVYIMNISGQHMKDLCFNQIIQLYGILTNNTWLRILIKKLIKYPSEYARVGCFTQQKLGVSLFPSPHLGNVKGLKSQRCSFSFFLILHLPLLFWLKSFHRFLRIQQNPV